MWRAAIEDKKRLCRSISTGKAEAGRAAIFNLTWYCIVSLVLTANDKTVPDSLTVAWFAAWTAELALLANIKIKGKDD